MKNENNLEVTGFIGDAFFFKGYLLDTKQREFRKMILYQTVEIISFDSPQGQILLNETYPCMLEEFLKDVESLEKEASTLPQNLLKKI